MKKNQQCRNLQANFELWTLSIAGRCQGREQVLEAAYAALLEEVELSQAFGRGAEKNITNRRRYLLQVISLFKLENPLQARADI